MWGTLGEMMLLLVFVILCCHKLESDAGDDGSTPYSWRVVFTPYYLLIVYAFIFMLWKAKGEAKILPLVGNSVPAGISP